MTERELLIDCLGRLKGAGLSYLRISSMASNDWGIPRTIHDRDFILQLPPTRVSKIIAAFSGDFLLDEAAARATYRPQHQFSAIDRRWTLKVDFWLLCPMPVERERFARRKQIKLFGEPAWIGTAEDMLLHKLYWNRITPSDRQIGDGAGFVAVQQGLLDEGYLQTWANELGVAQKLDAVLSGKIQTKQT